MKRQRLLEPLLETSGCRVVDLLELVQELLQLFLRVRVTRHVPRDPETRPDLEVVALGKVREDVALLVDLAALNDGVLPEDARDGLVERLRSVEDEEILAVGVESSPDHVGEELLDDLSVLGRVLPEPEDVRASIGGNPQRNSENVIIEVHAVDQDRDEIQVAERALHELFELLCADRLPMAADRDFADSVAITDSVDGFLV